MVAVSVLRLVDSVRFLVSTTNRVSERPQHGTALSIKLVVSKILKRASKTDKTTSGNAFYCRRRLSAMAQLFELPDELLSEIFKYLPVNQINSLLKLNLRINSLFKNDGFRKNWVYCNYHTITFKWCSKLYRFYIADVFVHEADLSMFLGDRLLKRRAQPTGLELLSEGLKDQIFIKSVLSFFPATIMTENMCCAIIEKEFRNFCEQPVFAGQDLVSICVIVSIVRFWSAPILLFFELVKKFDFTASLFSTSQISRLAAFFAIKNNATEFIRPIYRNFPDGVFERPLFVAFSMWTAQHFPEALPNIFRTLKFQNFTTIDCFSVVASLKNPKDRTRLVDELESTLWKDMDRLTLNRELYCYGAKFVNLALVKFFYERDHDVALGTNDNTAFTAAIHSDYRENSELLQFLYDRNPADIYRPNQSNQTPIAIAITNGYNAAFDFLIAKDKNLLHTPDLHGQLPIHIATEYSRREMICKILDDSKLGLYEAFNGMTPIHLAASHGDLALLELILSVDPDLVNFDTGDFPSPMYIAIQRGLLETVKYLKNRGAEIDSDGVSDAVYNEDVAMVELLISYQCDVNACHEDYWQPLFYAVKKGNVEIGKMLIDAGADINCVEKEQNWTLLHLAAKYGYLEFARLLIDSGSRVVNVTTASSHTPLNIASYNGFYDLVQLFLDHGAEIDIEDKDGDTALTNAVAATGSKVNMKVLDLLINRGADINHVTKSGKNIFHRCCEGGTLKTLEFLVDRVGCNLSKFLVKRDENNQTPYDICVGNGWVVGKMLCKI